MLQLSTTITNQPIMSLRSGLEIALATNPLINPNNLKIEGFYCVTPDRRTLILLEQDIREKISQGYVVDDFDVLAEAEDLVRLQAVIQANFDPIGKAVVTASKQKLGKVDDYAVDIPSFIIKKLYVGRSLFKSLNSSQLGVDRTQIIEITDKHIVIQDPLQPTRSSVPVGVPAQ